jgi:flavodoxin
MNILIAHFSQTGNTAKVAQAIYEETLSQGHKVDLKKIAEITSNSLDAYDLVFLGSACHDTDLARPVKRVLEGIASSPPFKLAGFVTHATYTPEGGKREREVYDRLLLFCRTQVANENPTLLSVGSWPLAE